MEALDEFDREKMLKDLDAAHESVLTITAELRARYAQRHPALKASVKAERDLYQLRREIANLDLEHTPATRRSPVLKRGNVVVDLKSFHKTTRLR